MICIDVSLVQHRTQSWEFSISTVSYVSAGGVNLSIGAFLIISASHICTLIPLASADATSSEQPSPRANPTVRPQHPDVVNPPPSSGPASEFNFARLVFDVNSQHGWGPGRPWWRIDWPEAEMHFLEGLGRYTVVNQATDSVHIELDDEQLFDYPWLFVQQAGRWRISDNDAETLGEYLLRGGFLLVDDLHGPNDWNTFASAMYRALPEFTIEDIQADDSIINTIYSLEKNIQIPGRRHIVSNDGQGNLDIRMPHEPHDWQGIKDADGRWIVAINYNMDMGDSWEHANDAYYPVAMTSLGYRLGMNYIIYALTH